ncbi:MAG TPA: carbohydrate binding domain-containing protein, partial [Longimicrobium sp.]|nr:carbohydrate binding domain-containing protein [Longimicrobium sp.]
FRDNFIGWRYLDVPWSAFSRGAWQPHAQTPNDGLNLTQVWGLTFSPQSNTKWFRLDQLVLTQDRSWTPKYPL